MMCFMNTHFLYLPSFSKCWNSRSYGGPKKIWSSYDHGLSVSREWLPTVSLFHSWEAYPWQSHCDFRYRVVFAKILYDGQRRRNLILLKVEASVHVSITFYSLRFLLSWNNKNGIVPWKTNHQFSWNKNSCPFNHQDAHFKSLSFWDGGRISRTWIYDVVVPMLQQLVPFSIKCDGLGRSIQNYTS